MSNADILVEVYSLPSDPIKDGHTFIGWFYDEDCTIAYDGAAIYEDTILYAGWQINTYSVTFVTNASGVIPMQFFNWNFDYECGVCKFELITKKRKLFFNQKEQSIHAIDEIK